MEKELRDTVAFLERVLDDRAALDDVPERLRKQLLELCGRLAAPSQREKRLLARTLRRRRRKRKRDTDEAVLEATGMRAAKRADVYATPPRPHQLPPPPEPAPERPPRELVDPRACYVCKQPFTAVHHFYDQMCGPCAELNWAKRHQTADLRGRVAVVTGARVKIGFQAAVMLLRAGCQVVATTRFPRDAARRYAAVDDFAVWQDRLEIHGLDLRHTPSVELLCRHLLDHLPRLDFVLNNACQTVRRPVGFYAHLIEGEQMALPDASGALVATVATASGRRWHDAAALSQVPLLAEDFQASEQIFPTGALDQDLQQVDLRDRNSWRLTLHEVSTVELLEVHLVNAVAPYVLNARLKPLMLRARSFDKHIVNVSAMEGQFYRSFKTDKHPHTNMAKAALNMMTRTSAQEYVRDGIHMNSVDTGWITDEDPVAIAERKKVEHRFSPPLDAIDGAARICDPIFSGFNTGEHVWGKFLKDYRATDW